MSFRNKSLIFFNIQKRFAFNGSNPVSFSEKKKKKKNETESRLPFSDNLKLKVVRWLKIAIGSEQWTCIYDVLDSLIKLMERVFSYISTFKLWGKSTFPN